mgnify:CR=1 FL=1
MKKIIVFLLFTFCVIEGQAQELKWFTDVKEAVAIGNKKKKPLIDLSIMKDGNFYWCDCGNVSESDLDDYAGTLICASGFRWRSIENHMGDKAFYHSDV